MKKMMEQELLLKQKHFHKQKKGAENIEKYY